MLLCLITASALSVFRLNTFVIKVKIFLRVVAVLHRTVLLSDFKWSVLTDFLSFFPSWFTRESQFCRIETLLHGLGLVANHGLRNRPAACEYAFIWYYFTKGATEILTS